MIILKNKISEQISFILIILFIFGLFIWAFQDSSGESVEVKVFIIINTLIILIGLVYLFPYMFKTTALDGTTLRAKYMFRKEFQIHLPEISFVRSRAWIHELEFIDLAGNVRLSVNESDERFPELFDALRKEYPQFWPVPSKEKFFISRSYAAFVTAFPLISILTFIILSRTSPDPDRLVPMAALLAAASIFYFYGFTKKVIALTFTPDALVFRFMLTKKRIAFGDISKVVLVVRGDLQQGKQRSKNYSLHIHGNNTKYIVSVFDTNEVNIFNKIREIMPEKVMRNE